MILHVLKEDSFKQIPEGLRSLAERALSNARRELEETGKVNPSFILQGPDGKPETMSLDNELTKKYFKSPSGKAVFYAYLRRAVKLSGCTAVVQVTDIWTGKPTEKFNALPLAEKERVLFEFPGMDDLRERGLMDRYPAILVNVQTPEHAGLIEQLYEKDDARRHITWLERTAECFPQEAFHGKMKMFGLPQEET